MEETEKKLFDGKIYRGDTFKFDFSATLEGSDEPHTFEQGDILKAGIKSTTRNPDYMIYQMKTIDEDTQEVEFEFSHEETMNLLVSKSAILEVELTNKAGKVSTLYQEEITIMGDVINE